MAAEFRIAVFLNPTRLFEWEEPRAPNLPDDPTPERLLEFLCPIGTISSMAAFRERYHSLDDPGQPPLFFSIEEPALVENLFAPLRAAATSHVCANYLGCIALCGLVAEKLAILVHDVGDADQVARDRFARLTQAHRVKELKKGGRITAAMAQEFAIIRETRRDYLHHWTQPGARMNEDSRRAYLATVRLVFNGLGLSFAEGGITLDGRIVAYLRCRGVVRDIEARGGGENE